MLPKSLTLQAFGPYVKAQNITFQSFAKQHLFLIRGETGSGKTVILDAITFALYGKSSGGQRDSFDQMRSRFADDEQMTYVSFEFQIHHHHYRFYRSLEVRYNRNKEKQIKMKIDAGELINDQYYPFFENPKIRSIEEKATELIGLNYDQFVQVMILPQGKFEQFLTSKSEDKQEILKNLFQMERYGTLIERLQDRVKELREEVQQYKQQKELWLSQIHVQDQHELLEAKEKMLLKQIEEETKMQSLLKKEEQLQKEMVQYERYITWLKDDERYHAEQLQLQAQKEKVQQIRLQCDQYQKVKAIAIDVERVSQAQADLVKRQEAAKSANNYVVTLEEQIILLPIWNKELESLKENIDQNHDRQVLCESLESVYTIYDQLQREEKLADEMKTEKTFLVKNVQAEIEKYNLSYLINNEEYYRLQDIVHKTSLKENLWLNYQQGYEYYQKQQQLKIHNHEFVNTLDIEKQQCLLEQDKERQLQEEHEVLYQAYLESSASVLSASLEDDKPCPVCGSMHHPDPARMEKTVVDLQQLRLKKQALDQQKICVEKIQRQHQKTEVLYEQNMQRIKRYEEDILSALGHAFDVEEYNALHTEMQQYEKDKERLSSIMKQLASDTKYLHELQDDLQKKQQLLFNAEQDYIRIKTQLENNRVRFLEGINTLTELKKYNVMLQNQFNELTKLALAKEKQITDIQITYEQAKQQQQQTQIEEQSANHRIHEAKKKLQEMMHTHHIVEKDLVVLHQESKIEMMLQQITAYDQATTRLDTLLREHEYQKQDIHAIDVNTLREQQDICAKEKKKTQESLAFLQVEIKRFIDAEKQLYKVEDELEKKEPYMLKMGDFVRMLRGDNSIGLERYVLGVMLSQVTSHANTLLKNVHYGRYQLYRSDMASGRTRKHGLELEIYDSYTCSRRNVISLSGGEKFLVSLALSLALSLVVQMRNGGVRLDAMFIDEGFGTLDEHSIADALSILQTMVSAKGMVGIISHVDVLKENIPQGIEVLKTKKGSHIHIRKGDIDV